MIMSAPDDGQTAEMLRFDEDPLSGRAAVRAYDRPAGSKVGGNVIVKVAPDPAQRWTR
jgi:hypothetical protein